MPHSSLVALLIHPQTYTTCFSCFSLHQPPQTLTNPQRPSISNLSFTWFSSQLWQGVQPQFLVIFSTISISTSSATILHYYLFHVCHIFLISVKGIYIPDLHLPFLSVFIVTRTMLGSVEFSTSPSMNWICTMQTWCWPWGMKSWVPHSLHTAGLNPIERTCLQASIQLLSPMWTQHVGIDVCCQSTLVRFNFYPSNFL